MYKDIFIKIGLSPNESLVYDFLLKNGESSAGEIIKTTPLKRGVVYNNLASLIKKDLINWKKKDKIAYFSPNHPEKLREFMENKENELQEAEKNLSANLPKLISDFNLISGRPGIRIYEGLDGVKKTINDSLSCQETLRTFADAEAVVKNIEKINNKYVAEREKLGIKKRIILPNNDFSIKYLQNYHRDITDIKLIDYKKYYFTAVMQIYDGKVVYINFTDNFKIGIIIEDPNIYQMQKSLFDFIWERSKTLNQFLGLSKAQ